MSGTKWRVFLLCVGWMDTKMFVTKWRVFLNIGGKDTKNVRNKVACVFC